MHKLLLTLTLSSSLSSFATLPDTVIEQIEEQRPQLTRALSGLHEAQHLRLLRNYVDMVADSPLFSQESINRTNLNEYVFTRFPFNPSPTEPKTKKAKELSVFNEKATALTDMLVRYFSGQTRGSSIDLNITCNNQSYEIPFEVVDLAASLTLKLKGVSAPATGFEDDVSDSCLEITFRYDSTHAFIWRIGTKDVACPIPHSKPGNCILEIAERLSSAIGKRSIELVDGSQVTCPLNKEKTDFRRLKTYQEGQGWYQKHGYTPLHNPDNFYAAQERFVKYKLSELEEDLRRVPDRYFTVQPRARLAAKLRDFQHRRETTTLAQFMSWLWDEDCVSFIEIDRFLAKEASGLEISKIYPLRNGFIKYLNR